jgi:5-methylcytosine-specific restriction protein B
VGAEPEMLATDFDGVNLSQLLRRTNLRLGALLGSGYEIGHAFFLTGKLNEVAKRLGCTGLADSQMRSVAYVLRSSVLPTIVEYFHEDWAKTRAVIGETVVAGLAVSLFEAPSVEESFIERLPEDYELVDGRVSYFADWWNPTHGSWDAARFRSFLSALASGA